MNRLVMMMTRTILMTVVCLAVLITTGCAKPAAVQLANGMVDSMAKGDFTAATKDFDAQMNAAMSPEKLRETWSQYTTEVGAFKSRTGDRETDEGGFHIVLVACQFAKTVADIKIVFDQDGKIGGLWFVPHVSPSAAKLPAGYASKHAEAMVDFMAKGNFASATKDFDSTMSSVMSADKLRETWSQLTAQVGAFNSRTGTHETDSGGYYTAYVACQFEKSPLDVKVVFDQDGKIGGLWFVPHTAH